MLTPIAEPKGKHPTLSESIEIVVDYGQYDSAIYVLEFIRAFRWRNMKGYGDIASIVTQCVIRHNGFVVATANCFKDSRDKEDNKFHAYKTVLAKALAECNIDSKARKIFWKEILTMKPETKPVVKEKEPKFFRVMFPDTSTHDYVEVFKMLEEHKINFKLYSHGNIKAINLYPKK